MPETAGNNPMLVIIALLAVAILLAVSNPSDETHREKIAAEFRAQRPMAGAVGIGSIEASMPDYHSVVIGSYTSSGNEIVSIGLLGMIWVVDLEIEEEDQRPE